MKINRLNAIVIVVVAILVVGALVYYEMMGNRPQETFASAPAASSETAPTPAAQAPTPAAVPSTTAEQPAAQPPAAPAAPAPDAGKVATAEPSAPPAATPSTSNSTTADVHTTPAPTTAGGQLVPSFDVVRVEPTGETVVAGNAEPDSKVEVLDGPTAVATATANPQGDWALALDNALKPGTHDLAIRTTSKDGSVSTLSDERVAVQVPEPGSKDVIVVLNAPNQPSRVFELPKGQAQKPAAPSTPQVATAEPPAATQPVSPLAPTQPAPSQTPQAGGETTPPAANAPAATAAQPSSEQAQPTQPVQSAQPTQPAQSTQPSQPAETAQQTQPAQPASPAPPAQPAPSASQQPEAAQPAQPAPPPAQPVQPTQEAQSTQPAQPAQPTQPAQPQPAQPAQPAQPTPPPAPTPTVVVSAVEADTAGTLYVAGTATTGEPVRAYLNDKVIGEAKPSPSGTWLVEVHREVPPGSYQVRADQISPKDGSVIARAEVPFERKIDVASLNASGSTGASGTAGVSAELPQVQTVIIKRGDNLWTIARNTWGKGIRWSTLYQANKDQIRNPHWIYPGQVFVMPVSPNVVKD
jgi:nucleoid-associated protein YgaU